MNIALRRESMANLPTRPRPSHATRHAFMVAAALRHGHRLVRKGRKVVETDRRWLWKKFGESDSCLTQRPWFCVAQIANARAPMDILSAFGRFVRDRKMHW